MTDQPANCQISPIDGTCATHGGDECSTRPLSPIETVKRDVLSRGPVARPTALYDLPIFGWAWREDGRDRRA